MLNPYINNHDWTPAQDLIEDLTSEMISAMGVEIKYCPREIVNMDKLFGEDTLSTFDSAYTIEMYWERSNDWGGQGRFFSKFGLQDQRQIELVVSRKRFKEEVTTPRSDITKPRVGDIVFLNGTYETAPFSITWVDEFSLHERQLNKPYTWKLSCELLTYSHERMNTGIDELDSIETNFENLNSVINEPMQDNTQLDTEMVTIKDTNHSTNPFGDF
jgi:hypothetical protein